MAGAPPVVLRTLVEKSMLERSLTGRFEIHELLRQYAREKLGARPDDAQAAAEAHAAHYLGKLPVWAEALKGPRQVDVLRELDLEVGNLAAAWAWAAENGYIGPLGEGLEGLCLYYDLRTRLEEGLAACQHALDHLPAGQDTRFELLKVRVIAWKAHFLRLLGQHEDAAHLLKRELETLKYSKTASPDTRSIQALLHFELGHAILPNDRLVAREHFQESLVLFEGTGETWRQAQALAGLGMVAHHASTFAEAVAYYQRSLALYESRGDPKSIAGVLIELAHNSLRQGLLEEGELYMQRGCEIYEQIGERAGLAGSYLNLGRLSFWLGRPADGISMIVKAQPIFNDLGLMDDYSFSVLGEAGLSGIIGAYDVAYQRGQQGLSLALANNFQRWEAFARWVLGIAKLGIGEFQTAGDYLEHSVAVYRTIEQNDELGWALTTLAYAKLELEHEASFIESLCEAIQVGLEIHALFTILLALPAAALYFVQQSSTTSGEAADRLIARAVELYALARRYPTASNVQWFEDVAGKRIAAAAAQLPLAVVEAARERGRSQDAFAVARELLAEFSQGLELSTSDS